SWKFTQSTYIFSDKDLVGVDDEEEYICITSLSARASLRDVWHAMILVTYATVNVIIAAKVKLTKLLTGVGGCIFKNHQLTPHDPELECSCKMSDTMSDMWLWQVLF
nr:hypothetical protein [Tanacetum cinerariifolium]